MSGLLHSAVALRICQPPPHPPHPTLPKQEFSVLQTASPVEDKDEVLHPGRFSHLADPLRVRPPSTFGAALRREASHDGVDLEVTTAKLNTYRPRPNVKLDLER